MSSRWKGANTHFSLNSFTFWQSLSSVLPLKGLILPPLQSLFIFAHPDTPAQAWRPHLFSAVAGHTGAQRGIWWTFLFVVLGGAFCRHRRGDACGRVRSGVTGCPRWSIGVVFGPFLLCQTLSLTFDNFTFNPLTQLNASKFTYTSQPVPPYPCPFYPKTPKTPVSATESPASSPQRAPETSLDMTPQCHPFSWESAR